ncbi:hypothetical protein ABFY47_25160 [Enterobacter ludwigii]|uniref:hypothetical protein n=1 Tax=Enterobacter ludwigii TaxID=299767 RepID=UPI003D1CEA77
MSDNIWSDFGRLTTLSINMAAGISYTGATLFGNGKNQVEVTVTIRMSKSNNEPLEVPKEELERIIYFCDYQSGSPITTKLREPTDYERTDWFATNKKGDYTILAGTRITAKESAPDKISESMYENSDIYTETEKAGETVLKFFISSGKESSGKDISVGVDIPGVGKFDTTNNGTDTINAPPGGSGSTFKSPKNINIRALGQINYGSAQYITISTGGLKLRRNDVLWTSEWFAAGWRYKEHRDGEFHSSVITFNPSNLAAPGGIVNKFIKCEMDYVGLKNSDISTGTFKWRGKVTNGFTGIHDVAFSEWPLASSIKPYYWENLRTLGTGPFRIHYKAGSREGEDIDVNLWYPAQGVIKFSGLRFGIEDSYFQYLYDLEESGVSTMDNFENYPDIAAVVLYKFRFNEHNTKPYHWQEKYVPLTISVTDMYGNNGKFRLVQNNDYNFDIPGIQ